MVKLVLGLTGTIGAGKDVVSEHLKKKYNFKEIGMGDLTREELKTTSLPENRENLQALSKERTDKFGQDYWIKKAARRVELMNANFVIMNGLRRPIDITIPKKEFGNKFKLILVDADSEIRFERLKSRNRPGDPKTLEEFKKQENAEHKLFDFDTTAKMADFVLKNEAGLEILYAEVDKMMKSLQ
ncbi:MAG: AAA family ATPase [DPANN group archaeon]|nr:AAA family ATPase [DPANN group archaeon]